MHSCRIHLRAADIDALGHVNNVVFVQYLHEARDTLLATADSHHWHVVVAAHKITFQRPLILGQRSVDVVTTTDRIGTTSFALHHEICAGEKVYLTAVSTLVTVDDDGPRALTASQRHFLEQHLSREP